jgi:hypothetical protein
VHESLNVPNKPPHRDLICPTDSGIFSIEDFENAQVGECRVDFFLLSSFFLLNLPQTFDARANRKIGLEVLTVLVATRVHRAVVGTTPPNVSRHEDNLRHFGTNGSDTGHRGVEFEGYHSPALSPLPTYSIGVRIFTVLTVGVDRGMCKRPRKEARDGSLLGL